MGKRSLIVIPCSGGKAGEVSGRLVPAGVADFIGHESRRQLAEGRELAFAIPGTCIDRQSPLTPALDLYTGNPYRVEGFKDRVIDALAKGMHCLIVSGGYGLLRPEEPIHSYKAHIQQTVRVWGPRVPRALADYVERNRIVEMFIACSTPYASLLARDDYGTATVHWCIPRVRPGEGPALREVPRRVGEAVIALIDDRMKPDARWRMSGRGP